MSGRGVKKGVLGRCWGFLTGDMEDRVIPDVMNDVFLPQGRYPENFIDTSIRSVSRRGVSRREVLGGH